MGHVLVYCFQLTTKFAAATQKVAHCKAKKYFRFLCILDIFCWQCKPKFCHQPSQETQTGPLNENKLMGFYGVFMDSTWAHDLGFYWSWSEAQKGAKDMGQIKAPVGGLPMTKAS